MEVIQPVDFGQLDSARSSPFTTAPSSPARRAGVGLFYFSAPTSPNRAQSAVVPFLWEESPGKPKGSNPVTDDFEFEFHGRFSEKPAISSADELFHEGKILPLKLPPRLQTPEGSVPASPKSPKSPRSPKRLLRGAFSRPETKDFDPFEAALEQTRKAEIRRDRGSRRTRSLSPLRTNFFGGGVADEESERLKPSTAASSSSSTTTRVGKRWSLKDLLFRSASEGRPKKLDVKNSSFRSTDSSGSSTGGSMRRSSRASPHELHYSANRTVSEELRKRTFLPYRRGLLACLGFGPGTVGGLARGLGSFPR